MLLMGAPRATALRCLHALGTGSCKPPAGALLIQLCIPGTRQAAWQAVGVQNNLLNDRMIFFFFSVHPRAGPSRFKDGDQLHSSRPWVCPPTCSWALLSQPGRLSKPLRPRLRTHTTPGLRQESEVQ